MIMNMQIQSDSVRIVLFDKDQISFTALTETDDPDNWKLPGGSIETDEAPDAAAERELGEELGLKAEDVDLAFAGELVNDDGISKRFIYIGSADEELIHPGEEIYQTAKFAEADVPEGKNRRHIVAAVTTARAFVAQLS